MRINIIRSVALILSLSLSGFAQAQYGGYSGSAYSGYSVQPSAVPVHPSLQPHPATGYQQYAPQQQPASHPSYQYQPAQPYRTVAQNGGSYESVPAPAPTHVEAMSQPLMAPQATSGHTGYPTMSQPVTQPMQHQSSAAGCSTCNQSVGSGATYGYSQPNVYMQAAEAPSCGGSCEPVYESCGAQPCYTEPTQISPWFAGMNMLFLTRDDNYDRPLLFDDAAPATTRLNAADADLDFALGYDVTVGSYIGCGQYAVSATWLYAGHQDSTQSIVPGMPGDYRANFRNWDRIYYDRTGDAQHTDYGTPATDESIYAYFDRAESYSVRRDSTYYGLELNLTGFGIGGAARAGRPSCATGCGNACGGSCNACCAPPTGCGGVGGPMIPACSAKLQMQWTTGLRWFHFEDSFAFSARSERFPAAPAMMDTFTYSVDTENEMFGLQLGGRLAYCLGCRTSVYAGLKAGLYANDASLRSRISADTMPARVSNLAHAYPTYANQVVAADLNDTVLASLAEIDLGMGYRICDCWTVRGGYRVLAANGVATAIDNINDNPANMGALNVWANDSLLLHGGYVGLDYNW